MIVRELKGNSSPSKMSRDREFWNKAMTAEGRLSSFITLHHYVTKTTKTTKTTATTLLAVIFKKEDIYMK